jgi:hypothetical protein
MGIVQVHPSICKRYAKEKPNLQRANHKMMSRVLHETMGTVPNVSSWKNETTGTVPVVSL